MDTTVQLTVHAYGEPQTPPMIVFQGKGLPKNPKNEIFGTKGLLSSFKRTHGLVSLRRAQTVSKQRTFEPRLLILDHALSLKNRTPAFVPPGCTSLVLNNSFKI